MSSPRPRFVHVRRARFRLTFYYTALQLVALVILGTFLYIRNERNMHVELEKFLLRDEIRNLTEMVRDLEGKWDELQQRLDAESRGERFYQLSFRISDPRQLDEQGNAKVLALSRAFREASPATRPLNEVEVHDILERESRQDIVYLPKRDYPHLLVTRPWVWTDPKTGIEEVRYALQVLVYLEPLAKLKARFLLSVVAAIPLFILISWFLGYALARKVLRPINQIARTARQITSSSLHERLVRSGSGDEFDNLAATLNDMIHRLEESFTLTRQFAADAAHELRTPLTIMKGEAEVALRSRSADPEAYRAVLESMVREYDRMINIITHLLLLAQADAGAVHIDREPVRLDELLREIADTFVVVAEHAGLKLDAGELPPVTLRGDRVRLHELFANLLDNAVKYTPAGGRVGIACSVAADEVRVAVSDTGIGIAEAEQEKVFRRFYRVEGSRSRGTGGAGLGLSIARWIASAHGGRIEVQSAVGVGSTFTVVLPLPVEAESQAATEPAPQLPDAGEIAD